MPRIRLFAACLVSAVGLATAVPASAAPDDPGRWTLVSEESIPLTYYQGSASDGFHFYFNGHVGLYRTDLNLNVLKRHDDAIPIRVHVREGYDHIGDIAYDAREGGR